MSLEQYEMKKAEIEAILPEDLIIPTISVDLAFKEAEALYKWCQDDKDDLEEAGLSWEKVTSLPDIIGACRYAHDELAETNENILIRTKAFTLLKHAVDEIRLHGKYAFWRSPTREKGYLSKYNNSASLTINSSNKAASA